MTATENEATTQGARPAIRCSFCQKPTSEVKKMVAGPGVYICDVCVALCVDIIAREPKEPSKVPKTGWEERLSDDELLALPRYQCSDLFDDREKAALDYTVAVMRTPVEVTDELFERMKEHFSDKQMVEITALLTVVNLDRFNAAFGIGSAGFSDGMVCVLPDRPAEIASPG